MGMSKASHGSLKGVLHQHLLLRGSREFDSLADYEAFVGQVMNRRNQQRSKRLAEELAVMKPLTVGPGPYRALLARHHIRSSMGEVGNCYDNAVAERVNGILKLEYGLDDTFVDLAQDQQAVEQAVWLYNHERPHLALNYQKPYQVYVDYYANHQSFAVNLF